MDEVYCDKRLATLRRVAYRGWRMFATFCLIAIGGTLSAGLMGYVADHGDDYGNDVAWLSAMFGAALSVPVGIGVCYPFSHERLCHLALVYSVGTLGFGLPAAAYFGADGLEYAWYLGVIGFILSNGVYAHLLKPGLIRDAPASTPHA